MRPRRILVGLALCALVALTAVMPWLQPGPATATGTTSVTSPDTTGKPGWDTSLALDASGDPVVSYYAASPDLDLRVMHCNDANCSGGDESIASPDTAGNVGRYTSLALDGSGRPVVAYRDHGNYYLKVLRCGNANCTAGNSIATPDSSGVTGSGISMALGSSDRPVISYFGDGVVLTVLHCGNATCTSGNVFNTPDLPGGAGGQTSIALDGSSNPVVAYMGSYQYLHVLHCNDANCAGGDESITTPDTDVVGGPSLALDASGYPVVSYYDQSTYDLRVLHCNDANCAGGDDSITTPDTGAVTSSGSLELDASGNPVIAYTDVIEDELKVMHCNDANCSGGDESISSRDIAGEYGGMQSLELDASGNPVVSFRYYDSDFNSELRLLHCGDPWCKAPSVFTVDSTGDGGDSSPGNNVCDDGSGNCTLRAAIEEANAKEGFDTIQFDISGAGPHTIQPNPALPAVTDPAIIDGTTEPGYAGTPVIELDGTNAGALATGLSIEAGSSVVHGLAINRFDAHGIFIDSNGGNVIEGNFIGIDASGTPDSGNGENGVLVHTADNVIGGTNPAARNVISSNGANGVTLWGSGATGNQVLGNYVGVAASGDAALGNGASGVVIDGAHDNYIGGPGAGEGNVVSGNTGYGVVLLGAGADDNVVAGNHIGTNASGTGVLPNSTGVAIETGAQGNTIGGSTAAERNVISGNTGSGVFIAGASASLNSVKGNYVGTDATGTGPLGNGSGVAIGTGASGNTIGGSAAGDGNVIAYSTLSGVNVAGGSSLSNTIRGNSIHSNGGLGIDLEGDGVTANDTGDGDSGPNNLQNYPVISSAVIGSITVEGTFNSTPDTTFNLDFYASASCDGSGNGEGETYLGSTAVTTDGSGDAPFSVVIAAEVPAGYFVTVTATDPSGNTSEFSACIAAAAAPAQTLAGQPDQPGDTGDGGEAQYARVDGPHGLYETDGDVLYFADTGNDRVRKIEPNALTGTISRVAGGGSIPCTGQTNSVGDGCAATDAILSGPRDVYVDGSGDLYIADTEHCRVRKVSSGTITTVAGDGTCGYGGDDGAATSAQLNRPSGVYVDGSGDLYIADTENCRVRKVSGGTISTVAGDGTCGFAGDNGAATAAKLDRPHDVYFLGDDLVIADTDNHRIRRVDLTSGVITTIAGTGTAGFAGDGGYAVNAQLNGPEAVSVGESRVFVADTGNDRIRRVNALTGIITTVVGEGGLTVPVVLDGPAGVAVGSLTIANTDDHTLVAAGVDPGGDRSRGFVPVRSCSILPGVSSIDWALPAVLLGLLVVRKRLGGLFLRLRSMARPRAA